MSRSSSGTVAVAARLFGDADRARNNAGNHIIIAGGQVSEPRRHDQARCFADSGPQETRRPLRSALLIFQQRPLCLAATPVGSAVPPSQISCACTEINRALF